MSEPRHYPLNVAGIDLVVEGARRSKPARFLREGEELPRDVWDNTLLHDADGNLTRLEMSYSLVHLSPSVKVGGQKEPVVLSPLSQGARRTWMAILVLGVVGFLTQSWFLIGGTYAAAAILGRRDRRGADVFWAAGVALVGLGLQVLSWTGVIFP